MKWLGKGFWHMLMKILQRYDGTGMYGLWLVSEDLKQATRNLMHSRHEMHQAQRQNKQAMQRFETTVDHLKAEKLLPLMDGSKRDDQR